MSLYIFIYYYITIYVCVPHFYYLSAFVGCRSSVFIRRIIYKFLNVCPFDFTAVAVSGKVERSLTGLTTPVGLTAVTPTYRPKSVRSMCNRSFGGLFYVVTMLFGLFCGCRGFCHRTESDRILFIKIKLDAETKINVCLKSKDYTNLVCNEALCHVHFETSFVLTCLASGEL